MTAPHVHDDGCAGHGPRSGLVLAGGRSRRMGRDKAVLEVDGVRLVDRAVAALAAVADDVVVASGDRTIPDLDVPQVRDVAAGEGPLAGLVAGLAAARHDRVLVLAVDMPQPDPALLDALAEVWGGQAAVIPSADGRPQPLHAVWGRDAAPQLALLLTQGVRSVVDAAEQLGARVLDDGLTARLGARDGWSRDLDEPADLDA